MRLVKHTVAASRRQLIIYYTVYNKSVLFFNDNKSEHSITDTTHEQFESLADILSAALWQTEMG